MGKILPILPAAPIPTEAPAITEHISTEGVVRERVLAIWTAEGIGAIAVEGVNNDVLSRTFTYRKGTMDYHLSSLKTTIR